MLAQSLKRSLNRQRLSQAAGSEMLELIAVTSLGSCEKLPGSLTTALVGESLSCRRSLQHPTHELFEREISLIAISRRPNKRASREMDPGPRTASTPDITNNWS